MNGNTGTVKVLLMSPTLDPNLRCHEKDMKRTALHWACWGGHSEVVKALVWRHPPPITITKPRPPEAKTKQHSTDKAGGDISHSLVDTALLSGDELSARPSDEFSLDEGYYGVGISEDEDGELTADWAEIQAMASYEVDIDINARDSLGMSPLHYAVKGKSPLTVAALLRREDLDVNTCDNGSNRAIIYAVQLDGHAGVRIVAMLLKHGALISEPPGGVRVGETILHVAALSDRAKICRMLIKVGADPGAADGLGITPLHIAAQHGHEEVADCLLREVVDTNVLNNNRQTPLLLAAMNGHPGVCLSLVECGADVNFVDMDGRRPIHFAAGRGHLDCVIVLLNSGRCMYNATDREGRTALHWAAWNGKDAVVDTLLQMNKIRLDIQDAEDRCTPMHHAAAQGHHTIVRALLQAGANPEIYDSDLKSDRTNEPRYRLGRRPLEVAMACGHDDVVTSLRLAMKLLFTDGGAGRKVVARKKIA